MSEGRNNVRSPLQSAASFFHHEAAGGVVLILAAALALILDNSPLAWLSSALLDTPFGIRIGQLAIDKPLLLWINEGLMAIFFFLVGLEIKRELLVGELSTREQAILPLVAAIGGMALPSLIYALVNIGDAAALRGWAIPAATDIAFAIGVLILLGNRVPPALKVFLLALAIIDDLGAIIIIALFYTYQLSLLSLALAAVGIGVLWLLNTSNVTNIAAYVLTGIFIWVCVLKSGVHATLAGVVVALAVPLRAADGHASPLDRLEHALEPWVVFGVLPLFAFANAGVSLAGVSLSRLVEPIPLGIALGLIIGKSCGIFGATWAAVRWGWASKPEGAGWVQVLGVAILGGIGFTMSLFIGTLAFPDPAYAASLRLGVLAGSVTSAVLGYLVLRFVPPEFPKLGRADNRF
ncbi:MAG TPA: Na+/H+ antiporter NhaA [Hyphomicrobiaceae bacterium]|nr:Na+/H+ antiporter NhaA [Hyphomicrobiaceae bacterium]